MIQNLVSVIIPSYGGDDDLKRCIDSVLAQTYNSFEVIVVDDNGLGTENQLKTELIMKQYEGNDIVKYICHPKNINGSAARNTGVKNSCGEYIALLDDDDVFLPEKLEKQVESLSRQSDSFGACYCSHETFLAGKKVGEEHANIEGKILYEFLSHRVEIASSSLLIKRKVYEDLNGFDESFRRHQDWEFVGRLLSKYYIKADDFYGFERHLEFRNSAKSPEIAKERREYYLAKMEPVLNTLSRKQKKEIILCEKIDIALEFLKIHKYKNFIKELNYGVLGIKGYSILFKRLSTFFSRGAKLIK